MVNTVADNSFFGAFAGDSNTTGVKNSFFGNSAGTTNVTGLNNSFFGYHAGRVNTASNNSFFGSEAGDSNISGTENSFFGSFAGDSNASGSFNTFVGSFAGQSNSASSNSFVGAGAGASNTGGDGNSLFGRDAGASNTTGTNNTFIGKNAGNGIRTGTVPNISGSNNTLIGAGTEVLGFGLTFATAIGAGATATNNNSVKIGRPEDLVIVDGDFTVGGSLSVSETIVYLKQPVRIDLLSSEGSTDLCRNQFTNQIATCSSSLRYKTDVQHFFGGLNIIRRLMPISFRWNNGGIADLGFGAEEVNAVEPLLATRNDKGDIEGVKYKQITTVLVNAVNEQQRQIDELKQIVCALKPDAAVCKEIKE